MRTLAHRENAFSSTLTHARRARLDELARDWLLSRQATASVETIALYRYLVEDVLLDFCSEHDLVFADQLQERDLQRLTIKLRQRPALKATTVESYMRTIGYFTNWLHKQGHIEQKLVITRPRAPKPVVVTLDREQMRKLCAAPDNERDRLMLSILTTTGLRAKELCRLTLDDYRRHGSGYWLKVHGKGARDRMVTLQPYIFKALRTFVDDTRPPCESDRIFVSLHVDSHLRDYAPLTPGAVRAIVKKWALRAGIDQRVYTHLLRHSFATEALRGGVTEIETAKMLGHADTRMLQTNYAHLLDEDASAKLLAVFAEDDRRLRRWPKVAR